MGLGGIWRSGRQEVRRDGESRGGWKIEEGPWVGRTIPSSWRESIRSGDMIEVATSRIAQTWTRKIWGGAGETGIAGRLEHISPVQGFGRLGLSVRSATAWAPAWSIVSRPIPDPVEEESVGTKWEGHPARADPGATRSQATNAKSVPDQNLIDRPRLADLIKPPTH